MEIKRGNIQIGALNRQFINSIDKSNSNNLTLNVNINVVNCTTSCQHQHQESLTVSGEGVHKLIDCLKSTAPSPGLTTQDASEVAFQSPSDPEVLAQLDPAFQSQSDPEVLAQLDPAFQSQSDPEALAQLDPAIQTQMFPQRFHNSTNVPALTNSLRISDSKNRKLRPGDAVQIVRGHMVPIFTISMYVGGGYVVCYQEELQVVVKGRLDMTRPYKKFIPTKRGTVKVFPPKLRVKRALKKVGQPCPVLGCGEDFAFWTFTGFDTQQSTERGFTLDLVPC